MLRELCSLRLLNIYSSLLHDLDILYYVMPQLCYFGLKSVHFVDTAMESTSIVRTTTKSTDEMSSTKGIDI